MAEHFTFEQTLGDSSQVHFDKRLFGTLAVDVYRLGYQFLARPTFSGDQYGSIRLCLYRAMGIQYFRQSLTTADDMTTVESVILFLRCLFGRACQFQSRLDTLQQCRIIPRFGDKIEGSCLHTLHGKLYASPGGHQYHRSFRTEYFHLPEQSQPFFTCSRRVKFISIKIKSGATERTTSIASRGPETVCASYPARFNIKLSEERTALSSSIIKIIV